MSNPLNDTTARMFWYQMCGGTDSLHGVPRMNAALAQMFHVLGCHGCAESEKQNYVNALRMIADALDDELHY